MRALIYAISPIEIEFAKTHGLSEVIIAPQLLSRRGTMTMATARELCDLARSLGITPVLEWDALMTESHFVSITRELEKGLFADTFRVRDAGAAHWLKVNHPNVSIQLLLEAGHHNLPALKSWIIRLETQLKRVCLSPELPMNVIQEWRKELSLEIEMLGLGPLLLFHSGRPLLSSLESAPEQDELFAEGASEESPHKGFILQENAHGTLMFHPKDLGLLERWNDLNSAGVDIVRIDHRQQSGDVLSALGDFLREPTEASSVKSAWDREWMRGYFDVNKSDILFPKLKNQHLRNRDNATLGEVLETKREGWLAVRARGAGLKVGQQIITVDPKGQEKAQTIHWMKDSAFNPVQGLADGEIGFIPWFSSAPARTVLLQP